MKIFPDPTHRITKIHMKRMHWDAMKRHVTACLPEEACGLLSGVGYIVQEVIPITNELHSSTRFLMDPKEQLKAMLRMDEQGYQMVGIYHSHTQGFEGPSETDLKESSYPGVAYLIWSSLDDVWQCRAYLLADDEPTEIAILIADE